MRILLDTNIVIHREAARGVDQDIGVLYRWLDNLHYTKCLHPLTVAEINKLKPSDTRDAINIKLDSYNILKTVSDLNPEVQKVCGPMDANENDRIDTMLLNEVYNDRVDLLITEDKKIKKKAVSLGITNRVLNIDELLERVTAENPNLRDYKVLSVKQELFGNIDLKNDFFDSFRQDYPSFDIWFNRKSDEVAYVCRDEGRITAFLYIKREDETEPYHDISPSFAPKKRLKVGTLKVIHNGYRLGERFLKIVFDNVLQFRVEEIYLTIYEHTEEQKRLVDLLHVFGFTRWGIKKSVGGDEIVLTRNMVRIADRSMPTLTFPYISAEARVFIVPIYPEYHTELFPDSILRTESPADFVEHEPHRNAIRKVYISRSYERGLAAGDVIVFYRTAQDRGRAYHQSVVTTIGIVEKVIAGITDASRFIHLCKGRSVFSDERLMEHWNHNRSSRPFIVNFLYAYSLPKRPNLERLIEMGVIKDTNSVPRGFRQISQEQLKSILREAQADDRIVVD